jgi:hypothetical protein
MTWLEWAEHHAAHGRDTLAEPLLADARETFETVGARPALARVDQLARSLRAAASPTATAD